MKDRQKTKKEAASFEFLRVQAGLVPIPTILPARALAGSVSLHSDDGAEGIPCARGVSRLNGHNLLRKGNKN